LKAETLEQLSSRSEGGWNTEDLEELLGLKVLDQLPSVSLSPTQVVCLTRQLQKERKASRERERRKEKKIANLRSEIADLEREIERIKRLQVAAPQWTAAQCLYYKV